MADPEELMWTAGVIIAAVVGFLVLLVFVVVMKVIGIIPGTGYDPLGYSISFEDVQNRPYFIAHLMTNIRAEDRNLLEHSLEAATTGSLNNSQSENLPLVIKRTMDSYKFKYYSVTLKNEQEEIFSIDNLPNRCGNDRKGICDLACNAGWVEINEDNNACKEFGTIGLECCKFDPVQFEREHRTRVVRCGANREGVCSVNFNDAIESDGGNFITNALNKVRGGAGNVADALTPEWTEWIGFFADKLVDYGRNEVVDITGGEEGMLPSCGLASIEIPDVSNTCKSVNKVDGESLTPTCCLPLNPESVSSYTVKNKATIPIFYKNNFSVLEVIIGE